MIQPAICQLSVVPVRAGASDRDEIVTQLLFGELVEVLDISRSKKNWCQVRCEWDGYEGWMDVRQLHFITPEMLESYYQNHAYCLDQMATLSNSNHFLPITMGATLPAFDGMNTQIAEKHYTFNGQVITKEKAIPNAALITKLARRYLFAPYLWGGRSPFGIDCSGFTQIVFKMAGLRLRRDASQQIEQGRTVDFVEQIQAADLAFFDNERGRITHVGIVLDTDSIIHASGHVRIDKLDHFGIFNHEKGTYSHKLRLVRRLLPDAIPEKNITSVTTQPASVDVNQISFF